MPVRKKEKFEFWFFRNTGQPVNPKLNTGIMKKSMKAGLAIYKV